MKYIAKKSFKNISAKRKNQIEFEQILPLGHKLTLSAYFKYAAKYYNKIECLLKRNRALVI